MNAGPAVMVNVGMAKEVNGRFSTGQTAHRKGQVRVQPSALPERPVGLRRGGHASQCLNWEITAGRPPVPTPQPPEWISRLQ